MSAESRRGKHALRSGPIRTDWPRSVRRPLGDSPAERSLPAPRAERARPGSDHTVGTGQPVTRRAGPPDPVIWIPRHGGVTRRAARLRFQLVVRWGRSVLIPWSSSPGELVVRWDRSVPIPWSSSPGELVVRWGRSVLIPWSSSPGELVVGGRPALIPFRHRQTWAVPPAGRACHKTAAFVAEQLKAMGVDEIHD